MKKQFKVGCIGVGFMGGALMKAVIKKIGGNAVIVTAATPAEYEPFAKENACSCGTTQDVLEKSEVVFIAVKPNIVPTVLKEANQVFSSMSEEQLPLIVSIAAGVKIQTISSCLEKTLRIVRIMPNMPALVGGGMAGLAVSSDALQKASSDDVGLIKEVLEFSGLVEEVPEELMDTVTAVSGSGPAFCFMFVEAMADAAVKCGMSRKQAILYAAQTLKGSAETVLKTGRNPAELKDSVCSPKGTTIAGVAKLEEYGFRNSVIKAVTAAYERSCELAKK